MEKPDFGARLIEIRNAKGLTQEDVAEMCKINVRTIQRIESGLVKPRAYTIKVISKSLEFDFYGKTETEQTVSTVIQSMQLNKKTFSWYLRDLFNLKTCAMKKISILSASAFLFVFLCISIVSTKAQSDNLKTRKSLTIQYNEDKSVKRVEAAFTKDLNIDSLVKIKTELQTIGITLNYKKIEFDVINSLENLECEVICNDGFSGSIRVLNTGSTSRYARIGFYRDYTPGCKEPFGIGQLDKK